MLDKAKDIMRVLSDNGFHSYIVGGFVRDIIIGVESNDIDIATNALPEKVLEIFPESKLIGESFGVVLVDDIQIATMRKDSSSSDGRHPDSVEYADNYLDDAKRRDFTINSMYMTEHGIILDPFNGKMDIADKVIKFIGNPSERIQEDYLRMLRAVRFAVRFGFEIYWKSFLAIQKYAPEIMNISQERIFQELNKIFIGKNRGEGLRLLSLTGLLKYVLPEIYRLHGCEQPKTHHPEGDAFQHTVLVLESLPENASQELCWAALLHDIGKPDTFAINPETGEPTSYGHDEVGALIAEDVLKRLKCDNDMISRVVCLVGDHMKFRYVKEMKRSKVIKFIRHGLFEQAMELHKADCMSSNKKLDNYNFLRNYIVEVESKVPPKKEISKIINGDDLIALGYNPGKRMGSLLGDVRDQILEGNIKNKEEAISYVTANWGKDINKVIK